MASQQDMFLQQMLMVQQQLMQQNAVLQSMLQQWGSHGGHTHQTGGCNFDSFGAQGNFDSSGALCKFDLGGQYLQAIGQGPPCFHTSWATTLNILTSGILKPKCEEYTYLGSSFLMNGSPKSSIMSVQSSEAAIVMLFAHLDPNSCAQYRASP